MESLVKRQISGEKLKHIQHVYVKERSEETFFVDIEVDFDNVTM